MSKNNAVNILIAEDNQISRELMSSVLKTQGFSTIPAGDGDEAINLLKNNNVDLALVDINMEPKGGFDFVKYLIANNIDLPVIMITADDSSDILTRASELGVMRVMQKPVDPDRLIAITKNVLKRYGHNLGFIPPEIYETRYNHEQLMQRAIELAERNAKTKNGGPFGAVVADKKGVILGEGVNGITSRVDPTAHAEIMAIRRAAEKLGRSDLSDCIIYCSSEPTMMGQALIVSVGITQIYYGLSHEDVKEIRTKDHQVRDELIYSQKKETTYTQIGHDNAMTMFKRWQNMAEKLHD